MRNLVISSSELGLKWKFIFFDISFHKSHIWEKSCSWDKGQNTLGQSDFQIFKSTMSLESLFFCMFIQIQGNEKLIEKYWGGRDQNWVWSLWSQDFKIGCMSRGKQWNKLIFDVFILIQENQKLLWQFLGGCGQKWVQAFRSWD